MRTYMLVSEVDVNISPAIPITSSPVDNWFRNRGCPKIKNICTFNAVNCKDVHHSYSLSKIHLILKKAKFVVSTFHRQK